MIFSKGRYSKKGNASFKIMVCQKYLSLDCFCKLLNIRAILKKNNEKTIKLVNEDVNNKMKLLFGDSLKIDMNSHLNKGIDKNLANKIGNLLKNKN